MDKVKIISADVDGKELRETKARNSYHLRCDGRDDDGEINEAIQTMNTSQWVLPDGAWQRIFGGK